MQTIWLKQIKSFLTTVRTDASWRLTIATPKNYLAIIHSKIKATSLRCCESPRTVHFVRELCELRNDPTMRHKQWRFHIVNLKPFTTTQN